MNHSGVKGEKGPKKLNFIFRLEMPKLVLDGLLLVTVVLDGQGPPRTKRP